MFLHSTIDENIEGGLTSRNQSFLKQKDSLSKHIK